MPSNVATGIYIARGDDTLGPYTPDVAAGLIKTGELLPNDLAARNGDAAWVTLASLLPGGAAPGASDSPRGHPVGRRPRRVWIFAVVFAVIAAVFLAGKLPRTVRRRATIPHRQPSPQRSVAPARPPTTAAGPTPFVNTPSPSPVIVKNIRLGGAIRLISPDGTPTALATVPVRAYRLRELTPYLEQKKAALQAELARLAPLIAAAESARNARLAAEHDARQALLDAVPGSDLETSLRFVHDQARAAVKDAENDCRYLLDQRTEALQGDMYFRDLPEAAATADTNTEGAFTFDLPPEEAFALAAYAQQATRKHYWLVKVSTHGEEQANTVLSDANETSSDSPESLILTAPDAGQ